MKQFKGMFEAFMTVEAETEEEALEKMKREFIAEIKDEEGIIIWEIAEIKDEEGIIIWELDERKMT